MTLNDLRRSNLPLGILRPLFLTSNAYLSDYYM